jgi:hypothetical protein
VNHRNSRTDRYRWQALPVPAARPGNAGNHDNVGNADTPTRRHADTPIRRYASFQGHSVSSSLSISLFRFLAVRTKFGYQMPGKCAQTVQDRAEWTKFASRSSQFPDASELPDAISATRMFPCRPRAEDAAGDLTGKQNKTNNSARSGKISPARLA